jgi:hypothetical protein
MTFRAKDRQIRVSERMNTDYFSARLPNSYHPTACLPPLLVDVTGMMAFAPPTISISLSLSLLFQFVVGAAGREECSLDGVGVTLHHPFSLFTSPECR